MKKILAKTASLIAVGFILSATPALAKSPVDVIIVDGKNTSSTADDTTYHLKVAKGKRLTESTITKVKAWAKHDTSGRSKITKAAYNPVVPVTIRNRFTSDTRLRLVYKQIKPIVTFYDPIVNKNISTKVGEIGKTIKFPTAPNHIGYQFVGWKGLNENQKLTKATKYKATAVYKKLSCKIVFDGNGASNPDAMSSVTVKNTQEYVLPKNKFKKNGYHFAGWEVMGKTYSAGETVVLPYDATTVTAKAVWEADDVYSITYNLNGGYFNTNNVMTSYTSKTPTFNIPTPVKDGCVFLGWTGTGLKGTTRVVTIEKGSTGSKEYYAKWKYDTTGRSLGQWQLAAFSGGQNNGFTTTNVPLVPHHSCSMPFILANRYGLNVGDKIQISTTGEVFVIDEIPRTSFNSIYYTSDYKQIDLCVYSSEVYNDEYNVVAEIFRVVD